MARFCTNCGTEIPEGVAFCTECGTKVPDSNPAPQQENPVQAQAPAPQTQEQAQTQERAQSQEQAQTQSQPQSQPQYTPLSSQASQTQYAQPNFTAPANEKKSDIVGTAYYFFMMFVFTIPVIGLITCIITAVSGSNQSKKNFSKAFLIWLIIGAVFAVIGAIVLISIRNTLAQYISSQISGSEIDSLSELIEQFKQIN